MKDEEKTQEMKAPTLEELRHLVTEKLDEKVWRVTRACLSSATVLLLEDVQDCPTLVLIGPPASSKTTVLSFFYDIPDITYKVDNFTPAAFVSHAANVKKKRLEEIDMLPKIKHKAMVVPELAPIFGKGREDLLKSLSVLTRVLDGQGYEPHTGSQGGRGYSGDYLFGLLGGTTPIDRRVWKVMGKLGSRLLFHRMPEEAQGEKS